ncbi:hypothetical protein SADUNF_Sadunf14G0060200 [Salix dunnii]|uniref:Pentatricopeptide repeat-containing protein n=1 Tax=Salix dunnii TaxID=1413687 RepID=A0A835JEZ2_9ROSI|nr:hypothetical protein SADUNF_Sadunf14G0060200 [Salix dunnii]
MPPKTTTHFTKPLSLLLSTRPRSLTTVPESTHSTGPHPAHSFCSRALNFSAKMGFLREGKQVHSHAIKLGFCNVLSLQNQILNVYIKCKDFNYAHRLFDEMHVKNVVTWNTVICGLVECRGSDYKSSVYTCFCYFRKMLLDKVGFDAITLNGSLRACLGLNDVDIGRELHCFIVKLGFAVNSFVSSALVDMYGKCGLVKEARRAFDEVYCRDLVLWNVMLSCYAMNCLAEEASGFFKLMQEENFMTDGFTFSSMLNSCGTMGACDLGRQIHGLAIKLSFDLDVLVASGLVDMYAKSENIDDARKAFDGMAARNLVSWNTMVVGYGRLGDGEEAMKLLMGMLQEDIRPDEITLTSIIRSCSCASTYCEIMQVNAHVLKNGLHACLSIANALINAYSKGGSIAMALQCFSTVLEPDLVTWTSLIGAYAFHSLPKNSIDTFEEMLVDGIWPDQIVFLEVLSACSHAGLVNEGLHYFSLMKDYHILPGLEHYTCLIDLLGRAGLLDEAFNILNSMSIEFSPDTLGAFIGACKIHGDVKLAKWAAEKLFEMQPNKPVNYTLMSSIFASEGHWHDVARIHKLMRDRCGHRVPGCSWMEYAGTMDEVPVKL